MIVKMGLKQKDHKMVKKIIERKKKNFAGTVEPYVF